MILNETYTLANGVQIPKLGLGTWFIDDDKTADPRHMADNADADFIIADDDMDALKHMEHIADYGDFNVFPVFSGKPLA